MARFDIEGFDDILAQLDRMACFDEVAPKMMEAGMDVLQEEIIAEASKHQDTGAMVASIKPTGLMTGYGGGYYMCTRPTGKDKKGVRNMEKLVYLEYGVKGRPATPVITSAVLRAEPRVLQAMREVFEREAGSGGENK